MPGESTISWTDRTWNATTGCTKVSPGCEHCYAEALSLRFRLSQHPWTKPYEAENVKLHPERLDLPLRWRTPSRIFVDSMSDLFHDLVPTEYIDKVFGVMAGAPRHTFQVLTKRPERMAAYLNDPQAKYRIWNAGRLVQERSASKPVRWQDWYDMVPVAGPGQGPDWCYPAQWPLPNVWLGTSVEDQRRAEERIPFLLDTPAAVRFLSCEPLLGPLDLHQWLWEDAGPAWAGQNPSLGLHWIITGGESGAGFRPADPQWFRDIRDQCQAAGVAFFHKQGSHRLPGRDRELDGQVYEAFPVDRHE